MMSVKFIFLLFSVFLFAGGKSMVRVLIVRLHYQPDTKRPAEIEPRVSIFLKIEIAITLLMSLYAETSSGTVECTVSQSFLSC